MHSSCGARLMAFTDSAWLAGRLLSANVRGERRAKRVRSSAMFDAFRKEPGLRSGLRGTPGGSGATLFDDLFLETLDKRDHVALFGLGHLELGQGRGCMT